MLVFNTRHIENATKWGQAFISTTTLNWMVCGTAIHIVRYSPIDNISWCREGIGIRVYLGVSKCFSDFSILFCVLFSEIVGCFWDTALYFDLSYLRNNLWSLGMCWQRVQTSELNIYVWNDNCERKVKPRSKSTSLHSSSIRT